LKQKCLFNEKTEVLTAEIDEFELRITTSLTPRPTFTRGDIDVLYKDLKLTRGDI